MRKKIIISYIVLLVFIFQGINTASIIENQGQDTNQNSYLNNDDILSSTNSAAGDYATLFSVIINEIMVNPVVGEFEWVELYFTGTGAADELDIGGYQLIIDDFVIEIAEGNTEENKSLMDETLTDPVKEFEMNVKLLMDNGVDEETARKMAFKLMG